MTSDDDGMILDPRRPRHGPLRSDVGVAFPNQSNIKWGAYGL
jgi:hypothetical protein